MADAGATATTDQFSDANLPSAMKDDVVAAAICTSEDSSASKTDDEEQIKQIKQIDEEHSMIQRREKGATTSSVKSQERSECNSAELLLIEESASMASVFSASYNESRELLSVVLQCPPSDMSRSALFKGANHLLVVDLQTQLFALRKVCSLFTSRCSPMRIWISLGRSTCAAVVSFVFLSSECMPLRCARYALGGAYRNALSACILSEVIDAVIAIVKFLAIPTDAVVTDNFVQYTAKKLAVAVSGMILASTIPNSLLTGHLVLCISHVLVDVSVNSLKKTSAKTLQFLLEKMSAWRASVRLSSAVLESRKIIEDVYTDDGGEWTCSELTF